MVSTISGNMDDFDREIARIADEAIPLVVIR